MLPRPSASGGPATNVSSSTVDSSAKSAGSCSRSATIAGSSVRTQAATGGVLSPVAAPSTISSACGAPVGSKPSTPRMTAVTVEPKTNTVV
jgi:hypothetical protein